VIAHGIYYNAPAELFVPKRRGRRQRADYRRFAVEKFPAVRTLGAWMQVGDERFDGDEICRLYESSDYPLQRHVGSR